MPPLIKKQKLVIDTCFWINIVNLKLHLFLLEYFEIYFTLKVEKEILNETEAKIYNTYDMEVYKELKFKKIIKLKEPTIKKIGHYENLQKDSGELYSVLLTIEERGIIGTDDNGAIDYCDKNNVDYINSVYFVIFLYKQKKITLNDANNYLNFLTNKIKQKYIDVGKEYLKK
jgi:hypothetical protein